MIDRLNETIVAVASPMGSGTVGIVRISGPRTFALVSQVCRTNPAPDDAPSSFRLEGELLLEPDLTAPVWLHVFRGPHSYTREDAVELLTIGSPIILDWVCRKLVDLGALRAQPGEFTARAFILGGIDLTQAQGVASLINANTDVQLRSARRLMNGHVARPIHTASDELSELLGLVEAGIDFAEEPIEFISIETLQQRLQDVAMLLDRIAQSATPEVSSQTAPRVLFIGPPNAGKSTLMNRLSGTDRSICANVAGTTRDLLHARAILDGAEIMLIDAAGLDDSADEIIARAQAMVRSEAMHVDAICLVLDASQPVPDSFLQAVHEMDAPKQVIAVNKIDLIEGSEPAARCAQLCLRLPGVAVPISALQGHGVAQLARELAAACANENTIGSEAMVLADRHAHAFAEARGGLSRAMAHVANAHDSADSAELIAFELREVVTALGMVVGENLTEDLFTRIFSRFCIGK